MSRMHYFLSLLICFGSVFTLKPHFFARQQWYNPVTKQTIDVFHDNHATTNTAIDSALQHNAIIGLAKIYLPDVTLMPEDIDSINKNLDPYDTSEENQAAIARFIDTVKAVSPLAGLCLCSSINNIDTFNIECRPACITVDDMYDKTISPEHIKALETYNDCPLLNTFYTSLMQHAQALAEKEDTLENLNFHYESFIVSARALHAIYTSTHKNIILPCGTAHCATINYFLYKLGWILQEQYVASTLSAQEKTAVESVIYFDFDSHTTVVDTMETFFDNFTTHIDIIREHGLEDIDIIKPIARPSFLGNFMSFIGDLFARIM